MRSVASMPRQRSAALSCAQAPQHRFDFLPEPLDQDRCGVLSSTGVLSSEPLPRPIPISNGDIRHGSPADPDPNEVVLVLPQVL